MDGYSVEEAAEVLGIPQGRVWELIARGVLAGASEGRSDMRVFLKPPAGTASPTQPGAEDGGGRANGGTHVEASPFRELLTEFRNLTERYGQALLALGEARGEVAALRSRVEVLEARMDLRLPLRAASTVAWELPDRYASERGGAGPATEEPAASAEPTAEPTAEPQAPPEPAAGAAPEAAPESAVAEPEPAAEEPAEEPAPEVTVVVHAEPAAADEGAVEEPQPPRRRVSGGRAAIAGLAEALARAEDPTLADLPGAREAGEALAALQRDVASIAESGEEAAQPEAAGLESAADAPEAPEAPEAPAAIAEEPEPVAEDIQAAFATPIDLPEEPTPEIPEPLAPEAEMPTAELPMPEAVAEPAAPASPYTTEVVEPDWFADGDFTWLDAGTADAVAAGPEAQAEPEAPVEPDAPPEPEGVVEEEPTEAGHEAEHIEAADEGPSVEAIQDAFSEAPTADGAASEEREVLVDEEPTQPGPAEPQHEAEHTEAADEVPSVETWPAHDRGGIAAGDAVGFNLFREPAQPEPPGAASPPSASAEEELLWFGDEFEAADLEMETPGWRAGERVPAEPARATVPPDVEPPETIIPDEEIERLAGDEGWDEAEVDAIRAYLGRTDVAAPEADLRSPPEPASREPDAPERPDATIPNQDWLLGRRGPAATAYRRLRRLIQG